MIGVQVLMLVGVKLIATDDLSLLTSGIEIRTLHLAFKYVLVNLFSKISFRFIKLVKHHTYNYYLPTICRQIN